jgi:hypothetical protein
MVYVLAACCALVASGATAAAGTVSVQTPAASGPTGTWGNAQPMLGLPAGSESAGVDTVSCASPGNCSAGGRYATGSDFDAAAFVVDETDGVWGKAQPVAGASDAYDAYTDADVTSVSCASPGDCSAGGFYGAAPGGTNGYPNNAFVVNETDGVWGTAQEVAGAPALNYESQVNSVSCTSPGNCSAGGSYAETTGAGGAFVVDETNGVWGTAHLVAGLAVSAASDYSSVNSVSCTSPGNCSAGGSDGTVSGSDQAFVADETNGVWGSAREVPGIASLNTGDNAAVDSVSCTHAGDCTAGGSYVAGRPGSRTNDSQAFVVDEKSGTWGTARKVPGTAALNVGGDAQVNSVSCASPGNCGVVGVYAPKKTPFDQTVIQQAFIANETHGSWGKAEEVPGTAPSSARESAVATSVSCASPGNCSAGGSYDDIPGITLGRAFVVDETNGVWGRAKTLSGITFGRAGGWSLVDSVSCPAAADCAAVGFNASATGGYLFNSGLVVDKWVHKATGTAVTVSARKVAYGHEQTERISVKVTAGSAGPPEGTVTVTSGAATICTTTLAAGRGSCALPARRFPAGPVKVTASYNGSSVFGVSASTVGFTVAKAATTTSLTRSATRVTYGHEQTEKLSVTVSPRFSGTPGGRVTVKDGRTTVCVITLKSGNGTCTLTAKRLPAGTDTVLAAYPGSIDYASSASAKKTLTIKK